MEKERCEKHGCEKEVRLSAVGWGDFGFAVCPACAAGLPEHPGRKRQSPNQDYLEILRQEITGDY